MYSTSTKTKYVYDLAGRIVSVRDYKYGDYTNSILKSSVEYTYADKTNYLTGISHFSSLGTQNIGYRYGNSANGEMPDQIYGVTWNNKNVLNYTYDGLGRLTNKSVILSESEESQLNTTYEYFDVENSDKTTTLLSSLETANGTYSYTYDALGNITSISDGTYTTSYVYDVRNQLVRENDQKAGKTYVYTYTNGNITSRKEYAYTTGTLGDVVSTETWAYTNSVWRDLLIKWNGRIINYDAIGNPLHLGNMSMTWQGRQLQTISIGTNIYAFDYNMDGQRISKTYTTSSGVVTKTEYYYNGSILAGEKTGDNVIIYMYDNNGDYFGFTYNGTEYYYVKNAQNDVTAITDADGNILVRYYYNAWGEIIDCQDTSTNGIGDINSITYRSYYKDEMFNTYMYYLNSRYYYPEMCRFLNADKQINPSMVGGNLFAYCNNTPVNGCDPCGTCFHRWDFWNDCEKCGGKTFKQKLDNFVERISAVNSMQQEANRKVLETQVGLLTGVVETGFEAYSHNVELETEEQIQNHKTVIEVGNYFADNPLVAIDAVTATIGVSTTYICLVGATSIPVIGQVTLGTIGLVCGAWGVYRVVSGVAMDLFEGESEDENK